jgi:hypothetical protein
MPYAILSSTAIGAVRDDVTAWAIKGMGVGLRIDYGSTTGTYPLFDETVVQLPPWSAEMFDGFWGIMPLVLNLCDDPTTDTEKLYKAIPQDKGAVDCRISVDAGATWLVWKAGAWTIAGAGEWTSFYDLNAHLGAIPFVVRRLLMRVRLRKGTDTKIGPIFKGVQLGYATLPNMAFEDVQRTLIRWMRTEFAVRFRESFTLLAAANTVDTGKTLSVKSVKHAYNLTADPTRQTDLATGAFSGTVVSLSAVQALGSVIEVEWDAGLPDDRIILQRRDADFFQELAVHSPALILHVAPGEEADKAKVSGQVDTINYATSYYWRERMATPVDYRIMVRAVASSNAEGLATRLCNAAHMLFKERSETQYLPTVYLGSYLEIVDFTPAFEDESLEKEGLSIKLFSCIICAREWAESGVQTGPLAREHEILVEEMA